MRRITEKLNDAYNKLLDQEWDAIQIDEILSIEKRKHRIERILGLFGHPVYSIF